MGRTPRSMPPDVKAPNDSVWGGEISEWLPGRLLRLVADILGVKPVGVLETLAKKAQTLHCRIDRSLCRAMFALGVGGMAL